MKLLVLGENATHRRMLSRALASIGYEDVVEASAELEARRHLHGNLLEGAGVDLVLVRWDGSDGGPVLLAPWIRATPACADVPVLVVSERAMPSDVVLASQCGASDYLLSPFDPDTLKSKIEALYGAGRALPHGVGVDASHATTATFSLSPASEEGRQGGRAKPRVLVVEDQESTRALIGLMLREEFELVFAGDLQQAVQESLRGRFAAVTIDINLERDSGLDLLELLMALPAHRHVPKVACTAFAMPGDRERLLGLGFDRYVSKPFRKHDLLSALHEAIGAASASGTSTAA